MVILKTPFPSVGPLLLSSSVAVVAFEDEEDGGRCALRVGGFLATTSQSLSTRTWDICALEIVGAGAGCVDLIPAPQEVRSRAAGTGRPARWIEGNFSADQSANEVAVRSQGALRLHRPPLRRKILLGFHPLRQLIRGYLLYSKEMAVVFKTNDDAVTFKVPQSSAKVCFEFN